MNLFAGIPARQEKETVDELLKTGSLRIERIVSTGHASPPDFWYDQEQDEWVLVLKGAARLRYADDDRTVDLMPGDFVNIPAHRKHRVEWTMDTTIWLAVHYGGT